MTIDPERVKEIFLGAAELPDQAAQSTYLDHACGGDAGLRERVEALLRSHDPAGSFLGTPAAELAPTDHAAQMTLDSFFPASLPNPHPDSESEELGFLAPPNRPDSLGRLGHYEVLQVLGKGGFGIVFRAFDDILQRVVAIKVMAPQLASTSPARKRFLREARSSAQVRHENVVQVYEVGEQPLPYLVMEFIPGETLQQRLDRTGPLEVSEILRIGRQIAEGLAAAHATDLIHRDIKPGNVLLEGGQHKAKITDFGLARAADDASMTQSGMIAGTPMYMAPEQALGNSLDQRADLFSLGSVLYQMVAGRPPFRANNTIAVLKRVAEDTPRPIREVIPETPQWLCDIIAKLHAKKPDDRFQSAREVADVLADCEAQLKANSKLQDFSRIPRAAVSQRSALQKWAAVAAVVLFFSAIALAQLEFAGVTQLFQGQATRDPIKPSIDATSVAAASESSDGWVQLFNGNDLTGWKFHSDQPGHWVVQNGILKGSKRQSHLFSQRGDYKNFHLRAEVKINLGGDSGILFRAPFELRPGRPNDLGIPGCYEAELQHNRIPTRPTGSISEAPGNAPPTILGRALDGSLTEPDEWFTYEVIAENNHFITKINGVEAANGEDPQSRHPTGHIALQVWHANTLVQFRKIEIKELPATLPASDGFVQLFNGKDLTGWKPDLLAPGDWYVEDGAIVGRGDISGLLSESGDYENFHLRAEVKINATGDSGIVIRLPHEGRPDNPPGQPAVTGGYEAQIAVRSNFAVHTGSVLIDVDPARPPLIHKAPLMPHRPDQWFVLEVIAEGNRIQTRVNGKPAADYRDDEQRYSQGRLGLQTWGKKITFVQFRKIEIKKLPPVPIAMQEPLPPTFKNSLGMEFVKVPKGKSWLGGGKDKLGDKEVEIPADFYLGKYEVTQEEWEKVMGENPSWFSRTGGGSDAVKDISDADLKRFPVENVSWENCQLFIGKLKQREKESGWIYRLPKEMEWEFACRGGPISDKSDSSFDYYFAKPTNLLKPELANFNKLLNRPCKVGLYEANPLGLNDLHGNVWEWCDDTATEYDGALSHGYRGGCWDSNPEGCRATQRHPFPPHARTNWLGLRLARVPSGASSPEVKTPPLTFAPFTAADVQRIAALPTTELVEEVRQEFKKRNPDYTGEIKLIVENERVTRLVLQAPGIRDLSPARALPHLEYLECSGSPTLEDLRTLQGSRLRILSIRNSGVSDLSPLQGLKLQGLECSSMSKLTDLSPLRGMPLTGLSIAFTPVQDLSPLKGMSLTEFNCESTAVSDLSPLAGMPLVDINYKGTKVTNISALQGMPLTRVTCDFNPERDAQILRGIKTLQFINSQLAAEFWKAVVVAPFTATDVKRIAALPAAEQIEEVRKELKRRNPGFDGTLVPTIEFDIVTGLEFFTNHVTDISPVRALTRLTTLNCRADGSIVGRVSDLKPLQGMQLVKLTLSVNPVSDLTPLKGMPLTDLHIDNSQVADLSPLAGMPLKVLNCSYSRVSNLGPLKETPLTILWCNNTEITDLSPVKGKSLEWITIHGTKVTDISALKGMPLTQIYLDFVPERDREILRSFPNLQKINDLPAAEFWQKVGAGPNK